MEINLPYKTNFSVNSMYRTTRGGKFLKREALNLRTRIIQDVTQSVWPVHLKELQDKKLTIGIIFVENWNYKNGEERKADLDNRLKFLIDSVFTALGLDDKMIYEIYARKGESELMEATTITIEEMEEPIW